MATPPLSREIGKTDALVALGRRAGLVDVDPYADDPGPLFAAVGPGHDTGIRVVSAADVPTLVETVHVPAAFRSMPPPDCRNERPASFPPGLGREHSPALVVAEIPDGMFLQFARAPLALADASTLVAEYSSRYAPLLGHYDADPAEILTRARFVAGAAIVLCDDIFPLNYSHWLADTLPRLAFLGARPDVSVIVSEQDAPFKRATLRACGIADERVVWLPDFAAARAERLLVPRDCRAIPHPAHKAAPWALDFLRSRVGLAAPLGRPTPRKLYVSRADAAGRRVLNEDAVMRVLAPLGYHSVTLSGRSVAEQAALFAGASRVVGPHGAGLTNIVFAPPGARLLEILPRSYGTPAFYLLAAGGGVEYASYVAADVRPGGRDQVDDVVIDLADFVRCCGALL
jgi:capsular polysaccharide biosynthesis protein